MKRFAALFALICWCAASAREPVKLDNAFNLEEVRFVKQPGNSTVTGKAFLRLAGDTYKDCAGFNVELLPVTAYSIERITKSYGNDVSGQILLAQNPPKFTPDVPAYHEMLLKSSCGEDGEFHFSQVPAGEYFVIAFIIWDDTTGSTPKKLGGAVMKRIVVQPNFVLNVQLKE